MPYVAAVSAACRRWAHFMALMLILPVALSSALPALARIVGDLAPHVCHCAMSGGHAECDCPFCNHESGRRSRVATFHGPCGDDRQIFGGALGFALPPPPGPTVLPPNRSRAASPAASLNFPVVFLTPPTPPPRALSSY